jgi:hypothetical protein
VNVVIIPAFNESARIAKTVMAVQALPEIDAVLVVDDASSDATADIADRAGADVARAKRNRGKGGALERGVVEALDRYPGLQANGILLFLDADLEGSAADALTLLAPVASGRADVAVGLLAPQQEVAGGHGFVVSLAREGVEDVSGRRMQQPLCGQRALTVQAATAVLPFARGFGVEVGMTIDLLRQGFRVVEVPTEFRHRVTGRDLTSQLHRGRQFFSVWRALRERKVGPALPVPKVVA